jgi:hypothetical protein
LPAALAQPLQAMFKKNFEQLLIPAFEAACKNMFEQVCRIPAPIRLLYIHSKCAISSINIYMVCQSQMCYLATSMSENCFSNKMSLSVLPPAHPLATISEYQVLDCKGQFLRLKASN